MTNVARKADAFITLAIDVQAGRTMVTGVLYSGVSPDEQIRSFTCLADDAQLMRRLPQWLAELRAEASLGRVETQAEQRARLAAYSSCGSATTEITSLNSTCTSLGPSTGPRSLTR